MTKELLDFYSGFEGEPELLFFLDGDLRLRCWEGHVSALFERIAPKQGQRMSLAEAYHFDVWGDRPWQVTDNASCLAQLRERPHDDAPPKSANQTEPLRLALIGLFEEAVSTAARVAVRRD